MQFVPRKDLDVPKYDACISSSDIENVFCYSWYLDATAENWGVFVANDYKTVVPIPYKSTLGLKRMYQPTFTRELDIFGDDFGWNEVIQQLEKDFKAIQFRNTSKDLLDNAELRMNQQIDLSEDLKFSTNAKRLIKKAESFLIQSESNHNVLIDLFKATAWTKIDSISEKDLDRLQELMTKANSIGSGIQLNAYNDGILIGSGFFLKDKKRIIYLKGASTEEGKKAGVMFAIMNQAIQSFKDQGYLTFDFGGSDVESVANFYKKFGATDRTYYNYNIDNLPLWFKTMKKLTK